MTPRTSVRAAAREIYTALAETEASASRLRQTNPASGPSPQKGGESRSGQRPYAAPCAVGPDLMAQVRALYEDSAVPVREIARRVGVTERTLYKYVERQTWRRRYRCVARDEAVATANRARGWQACDGFAPAKGAGGRFVRREDADKPFAKGLGALDPAARAKAQTECAHAARLSRKARRRADEVRRLEADVRVIELTARAVRHLNDLLIRPILRDQTQRRRRE